MNGEWGWVSAHSSRGCCLPSRGTGISILGGTIPLLPPLAFPAAAESPARQERWGGESSGAQALQELAEIFLLLTPWVQPLLVPVPVCPAVHTTHPLGASCDPVAWFSLTQLSCACHLQPPAPFVPLTVSKHLLYPCPAAFPPCTCLGG